MEQASAISSDHTKSVVATVPVPSEGGQTGLKSEVQSLKLRLSEIESKLNELIRRQEAPANPRGAVKE